MRRIKLKALAATLITTFLLGSNVVMADNPREIAYGTILRPGESFYASRWIYIDVNDAPEYTHGLHFSVGSWRLGDAFEWKGNSGQWILTVHTNDSESCFYGGYGRTDSTEHPIGFRCTGGDGTYEAPYTFELLTTEGMGFQVGELYFPGDSLTVDTTVRVKKDDSALQPPVTVSPNEYVFADEFEWHSGYRQWSIGLNNAEGYGSYYFYLGQAYATGDDTPEAIICTGGDGLTSDTAFTFDLVTAMYRLYNPNSGEHFYTANPDERRNLINIGWNDEGIGWYAPMHSNTPVYRLYNPNAGEHHYTTDEAERNNLISLGWNDEGIGWYSDDYERVPLYRQYNPNEFANNHNYTTSLAENDWLVSLGWRAEGTGWYGVGCQF